MTGLTLVRQIRAQPAVVFEAMTTPEGIAHWWAPDGGPVLIAETDPRVGGLFRVRFRLLDGSEHESRGEYLEVIDSRRLVMSWRWVFGGVPDECGGMSRVEIDLRPIEIGTELTVTHTRLRTEDSRNNHAQGWAGTLARLEDYSQRQQGD